MPIRAVVKKSAEHEGSEATPGWCPVSTDETGTTYQDHGGRLMTVRHRVRRLAPVGIAVPPVAPDAERETMPAVTTKPITTAKTAPADKPVTAAKAKREKKKPTGDYDTGYCRPPVEHQFDGSKPGPGRPKNSVSQDTLLKKHLTQKRPVTVAGKTTKMQAREIVAFMTLNQALTGDRQSQKEINAHSLRLFPDNDNHGGKVGPSPDQPTDLDANDQAILDAYRAKLLASMLGVDEGDDPDGDVDDAGPNDRDEERPS